MTSGQYAKAMIAALELNGVKPVATHTAAPGPDAGRVETFLIAPGKYAIRFGNAVETRYATDDNIDDLASWIVTTDDPVDVANMRDANPVEVPSHFARAVRVVQLRALAFRSRFAWVAWSSGEPCSFPSVSSARAWIRGAGILDAGSRSYFVVPAES